MADTEPKPATPEIPVQEVSSTPITVAKETALPPEDGDEAPATTEAAPATTAAEPERKVEKLPDWAQKTIKDNAYEAREARRQLKAAQDELARLKTTGQQPTQDQQRQVDEAAARANAPAKGFESQADFDAAVRTEANRRDMENRTRTTAQEFGNQLNTVWESGVKDFGDDFATIADNLNAIGVLPTADESTGVYANDALMRNIMAAENPAKVLHFLGANQDGLNRAKSLLSMTPEKRAFEIAKLDMQLSQPVKSTPLSKVPKPIDTVDGSVKLSTSPRDDMPDEQWFKARNAEVLKRREQMGA